MALVLNPVTGLYETDSTPGGSGSQKLWSNFDDLTERSGGGLLNPRKFGVKADGVTDDTAAWATAIAAWKASGQFWGIAVPRGTSLISGTLLFSEIVGLTLAGAGPRQNLGSGYDAHDRASVLKVASAGGMNGVPMLDFYKCHDVLCSGFTLVGNTTDTVTASASAGIRYRSSAGAWGNSQFEVHRVHFHRLVNGFQAGDDSGTYAANDAETRHRGCKFATVTNAYRIQHNQSVNHLIEQPDFNTVTNGLYLARANVSGGGAGGRITMRDVVCYYVDRVAYAVYGGTNSGVNIIDGCRFDNPSVGGKRTKILEMESGSSGGSYWDIRAVTDTVPNVAGGARVILQNGGLVRMTGCMQLCGPGGPLATLAASSGSCFIEVTGCEVPEVLAQIVTVTGTPASCRYNIHDNHSAGVPHGQSWRQ